MAKYFRILLLVFLGAGFMEPYLTHGTIGGSDAVAYSNGISDFVTQVRAGVFPVWVGQTEFSIFGGEFPPRFAPVLQHQSALVDVLTGQRLPLFMVLNVALAVSLIGGLLSCYFCLNNLIPERPWASMALAILYGSCPGVIGLAYAQDLYLSFSTLPFLPLIFLGMIRSFDSDGARAKLLMAGGLAGTWLAHPPIAMWVGFLAMATQCVRICQLGYGTKALLTDILALAVFFVLAGYSFVSALGISSHWWMPTVGANDVLFQVRQAFPGNWLPLARDVPLENLQVGYGLSAILTLSAASLFCLRREPRQIAIVAGCGVLLALVTPIPLVTAAMWRLVPQKVLVISNIWPTQRLMVIIALCAVFSAALRLRQMGLSSRLVNWLVGIVLSAAVAWSGFQWSRLAINASRSAPSIAATQRMRRPENLVLSASTYGIQVEQPRYAALGVMDPELEHHFLDRTTWSLSSSMSDAIFPGFGPGPKTKVTGAALKGTFGGKPDANPGILDISPTLRLEPGVRYLLAMEFLNIDYTGLLILRGPEFYREYRLPISGESRSFGTGPESSRVMPLWTSVNEPEEVQLQFVPTGNGHVPLDYVPFARFELRPYRQAELPVQLESLFPYRARVTSTVPVFLETPKLYLAKYIATVDGADVAVQVSPDGYVTVPIESGTHTVSIRYFPPLMLRLSYWIGILGWLILISALAMKGRSSSRT
jgi:hypothetical protein